MAASSNATLTAIACRADRLADAAKVANWTDGAVRDHHVAEIRRQFAALAEALSELNAAEPLERAA